MQKPCSLRQAALSLVSFRGSEEDFPDDSMSLAASDAKEWSGSRKLSASCRPRIQPTAGRRGHPRLHEGSGWDGARSSLDEWFLSGRRQWAPRQRPTPFFPEVPKSWRPPCLARIHSSVSAAFTSIDDASEKLRHLLRKLWPHISARPQPWNGRLRLLTLPSPAGPPRPYKVRPTPLLDSCRSFRPNSYGPWMSLTRTLPSSRSCAAQQLKTDAMLVPIISGDQGYISNQDVLFCFVMP